MKLTAPSVGGGWLAALACRIYLWSAAAYCRRVRSLNLMNDLFMRAAYGFGASVVSLASLSCARKIDPSIDAMNTGHCDTTSMKPFGRVVDIPEAKRRPNYGALTGAVVQAETGDAIEGAVVDC